MENLEMISFQIISCVGTAKSSYIEAARKAQEYEFDKAEELIKEGDAIYIKGHEAHASLIQQEARGESVAVNMLLMHAEDQLMAAENFKAFAQQQIVIFKKFQDIENRLETNMKRVYLFCDNGMSTSMMAQRMQDVADSHNLPIECKAFSYKIIQDIIEKNTLDCILIGPQTKFLFDEINKKYGDKTPVMVIDPTDYGMMDAEKVLKKAIVQMKKFKNK